MFAVPGWAISSESLVPPKSGDGAKSNGREAISPEAPADSKKKRKRNEESASALKKVSGADLERLWDQRFGKVAKVHESAQPASVPRSKEKGKTRHDGPSRLGEQTKDRGLPKPESKKPHKDADKKHVRKGQNSGRESGNPNLGSKASERGHTSAAGRARPEERTEKQREEESLDEAKLQVTAKLATLPAPPAAPSTTLTPLQASMRSKLTSARFRHLNQTLYTTSSTAALELFTNSPDLFAEYHAGFSQQVKESWPQNPVDHYIRAIKTRGQISDSQPTPSTELPLPRRKTGSCTIADLGCGDAPLARGCQSQVKSLKLKFHNFDLQAANSHVTKADISNLPLRDGEADIAVFCLSLMGTNWLTFVEEAWRILRGDGKGEVWVAEVKSRFGRVNKAAGGRGPRHVVENSVGKRRKPGAVNPPRAMHNDNESNEPAIFPEDGPNHDGNDTDLQDSTDISSFVEVFSRRGFSIVPLSVQKSNKMFVSMIFVKSGVPRAGKYKGLKWNGREYSKPTVGSDTRGSNNNNDNGKVIKKFIVKDRDHDEESDPLEEAKVLKPCVYKTR